MCVCVFVCLRVFALGDNRTLSPPPTRTRAHTWPGLGRPHQRNADQAQLIMISAPACERACEHLIVSRRTHSKLHSTPSPCSRDHKRHARATHSGTCANKCKFSTFHVGGLANARHTVPWYTLATAAATERNAFICVFTAWPEYFWKNIYSQQYRTQYPVAVIICAETNSNERLCCGLAIFPRFLADIYRQVLTGN